MCFRTARRHEGILNYIAQCLDKGRFEFHVDVPGYKTRSGGTVPISTGFIAEDRPDIVLIDRKAGTFDIFELTVCFDREANFTAAHRLKDNRYAYYLKDMTALKPSVTSFEIGTRGFVSKDNYERLRNLHKFCRKGIKLSEFINNISALAINASYFIFICRKEGWEEPPFLNAPFNTS